MAKPAPLKSEDPGLDLIKRYMLLTMAMMDAISQESFDDFRSLLDERESTLQEMESLPFLTPQAIREFNIAVGIDDELQATMKSMQGDTVKELVEMYKGKKSEKAYKKSSKKPSNEGAEIFLQAS